ncbi:hypothetical protein CBR_g24449, partial [Chara braunii]
MEADALALERRLEEEYDVQQVIGRGGFSYVRKAVRKADRQSFAVKTLRKTGNDVLEALVMNEIRAMTTLIDRLDRLTGPHPNIVNLEDVYETGDAVHLVMELCDGGELFDRIIRQERYSELAAASIVRQIANGLSYLHGAHIVHRDLKPENCLFKTADDDSPLKIIDFGLSHVDGNIDRGVNNFATLDYVAPEMLPPQAESSSASDMWSLGVILYILLSGYPPFYERAGVTRKCDLIARVLQDPWVTGDRAKQEPVQTEVVNKLRSFNARTKFKAAGFASIASNKIMRHIRQLRSVIGTTELSEEEVEQLHTSFRQLSVDGRSVQRSEFEQMLRAMNLGSLVPIAPRIFEVFDNNHDGTVDMREIICGLSSLRRTDGDTALR